MARTLRKLAENFIGRSEKSVLKLKWPTIKKLSTYNVMLMYMYALEAYHISYQNDQCVKSHNHSLMSVHIVLIAAKLYIHTRAHLSIHIYVDSIQAV